MKFATKFDDKSFSKFVCFPKVLSVVVNSFNIDLKFHYNKTYTFSTVSVQWTSANKENKSYIMHLVNI